jgi:hypothetical protein
MMARKPLPEPAASEVKDTITMAAMSMAASAPRYDGERLASMTTASIQ